jgi:hypothetical protein
MDKLHQAQVKAYREAAVQSVKEWALSFPLQPMEEGDSKIVFVNRCITSITTASGANAMPNWKFENAKATALNEIRKHANATFEKYHPAEEDVPDKENEKNPAAVSGEAGTADEAEDESEGGGDTEDGEMTGDDDNVSDQEQTTGKYVHPNRKKNKVAGVKKTTTLKKGTRAKNGFRNNNNNKGGRGARRGGRGGGNRVQK